MKRAWVIIAADILLWAIILSLIGLGLAALTGCAAKKPVAQKVVTYEHCHEVAVDAKTGQVTLLCPPRKVN